MSLPSLKPLVALVAKAKKAVVAALGTVAILASSAFASGTVHSVLEWVLAAATALGVYSAKNAA